jgi:hypothetical protein
MVVILCAGCASYQYDVVQPTDHAAHVTADQPDEFALDGLQYRLIEYDGRLVMEIFNPTNAAIELTGGIGGRSKWGEPSNSGGDDSRDGGYQEGFAADSAAGGGGAGGECAAAGWAGGSAGVCFAARV